MLATLAAVALASAAGAASKEPVCTAAKEGTLGTVTATRRIGTRPGFTVSVSTSRDANEETVINRLLIRRGRATVLDVVTQIPPGGPAETRAHFEKGYKGVHDVLLQQKGAQYVAVVDGRETAPFTPGVSADQVYFPDGEALPTVRVGRAVKKLLKRLTRLGTPPCLAGGEIAPAAAAIRPAATCRTDTLANCETFPGCDGCVLACGVRGYACMAKALLCGPFCFLVGGIDCNAEARQCSEACRAPTQPCCPTGCPFRGSSSYKCFGAGNVCCEWDANGIPEGCAQDECCGPDGQKTCCSNGYECAGPYSLCCPRGEPAAVCPGRDQCCPSGLACKPGSLGRNTCCAQCCDPLTPCCNVSCCPGPDYTCVAGGCCPNNRVCGTTCCPDGYACTNPTAGTCQACPAGETPCAFGSGAPLCCPQGTTCCGNGSCCAANEQCCVFRQGLGCYTSCANLKPWWPCWPCSLAPRSPVPRGRRRPRLRRPPTSSTQTAPARSARRSAPRTSTSPSMRAPQAPAPTRSSCRRASTSSRFQGPRRTPRSPATSTSPAISSSPAPAPPRPSSTAAASTASSTSTRGGTASRSPSAESPSRTAACPPSRSSPRPGAACCSAPRTRWEERSRAGR